MREMRGGVTRCRCSMFMLIGVAIAMASLPIRWNRVPTLNRKGILNGDTPTETLFEYSENTRISRFTIRYDA